MDSGNWTRALGAARRQKGLIAAITLLSVAAAGAYAFLSPAVYEGVTWLQITDEQPEFRLPSEVVPFGLGAGMGAFGESQVQTDQQLLRSRHIAVAVVDSLRLRVRLAEARLPRDSLLQVLAVGRGEDRHEVELRRGGAGYTVRDGATSPFEVRPGQTFQVAGATLRLLPSLAAHGPDRMRLVVRGYSDAVEDVRRNLAVRRPDPAARVLEIRYANTDRVLAGAVPNAVTRAFIDFKAGVNRSESGGSVTFLRQQAETYAAALQAAEDQLRQYRERASVIDPAAQGSEQVKQLVLARAELEQLRADRKALADALAQIEGSARGDTAGPTYGRLAALPSFLASGAVQTVFDQLVKVEGERSDLATRRTPDNADMRALDERADALRQQLRALAHSHLQALDVKLGSLGADYRRQGGEFATIPSREVGYTRLVRQQKLLEQLYNLIQTRLKEAEIQAAAVPTSIQVVDPAVTPRLRSYPRRKVVLLAGLLAGLVLGAGAGLARERFRTRVRTGEEAGGATGLPVLAAVPARRVTTGNEGRRLASLPHALRGLRGHLMGGNGANGPHEASGGSAADLGAVANGAWANGTAHSYRNLRTRLALGSVDAPQVILLTGSELGEGTTTTAINLARALAQQGMIPLLVDAATGDPALYARLHVARAPGVVDVLRGRVGVGEAVAHVAGPPPLDVLVYGGEGEHDDDVWTAASLRPLLAELRQRYAAIVIDGPPATTHADAAVLASLADATLIVARENVTRIRALRDTANQLAQGGGRLRGIVLTAAGPHA